MLLAGGHSLIPMMKLRLAAPGTIIDIGAIPGLTGIAHDGKRIEIGALTTHAALASSRELEQHAPVLWQAANELGDPQVRNRGTVGGACAHGDPSADYPAVMLALDATFTLTGADGTRDIGADAFFLGMFETALDPLEILTSIAFASAPNSAYAKFHHPASGYAVVGAAVKLTLAAGRIAAARVAFTGVGDAAFRALGVEAALAGVKTGDSAALDAACRDAAAGIEARGDTFASGEYRAAMADVFVRRAVAAALQPG
jgi:carbon-monoxide dehydrogenase medium subunit